VHGEGVIVAEVSTVSAVLVLKMERVGEGFRNGEDGGELMGRPSEMRSS
jgi:hypothetical protein